MTGDGHMRQLIYPMKEQYEEFLIDESKFSGYADSISFPESAEEMQEVLQELKKERVPVTIQGGKTGITGAGIPRGGHVMNLSHMNKVKDSVLLEDGTGLITVEPGINLIDLGKEIAARFRKTPLFWPPDPTESSATAGGIAATNAQGICRLLYGPSRDYIASLKLMNSDGEMMLIEKGQKLTLASGREIDRMDAVLGKEGITGAICELTLKLIPKPQSQWGIAFFFGSSEDAGRFVDILRLDMPQCEHAKVAAVEYIDRMAMNLIEEHKATMTKIKELPDIGEETQSMVYIELHGDEEEIEILAESLMESAMVCNSDPEEAWAVSGETDVEKMHAFRHGAAETSNLYIEKARQMDARITKLGTDMTISGTPFSDILSYVEKELHDAGLKGSVFGHAMENHLHVNILPENYEEYEAGIQLIRRWALQESEHQGKVVGEHGIGKLKLEILDGFVPERYTGLCKELKRQLDKDSLWNNGNIFKEEEAAI